MTCEHGIWIGACSACKPIHTNRDQAWHFDHPVFGRIDSKGAFDRHCKAKGWVRVSTDELMTRGEPTKRALPDRREIAQQVEGVIREVKAESANAERVERKWRETQERVATPVSPVGVDYAGKES